MSAQIGHLRLVDPAQTVPGRPAAPDRVGAAAPAERPAATADVIGAAPPHHVSEDVAKAADRAQELAAANRELHFVKDKTSGRIIVQVRDLDGNVLRTIPPSEALDVMSGLAHP